jgi:general secretion pathway protein K
MNLSNKSINKHGIALIIVMIMIVVFAILAGGLAYSMKVETKLARNSNWDTEMEWLGRSGIEFAKYLLTPCGQNPGGGQFDSLGQKWAGGMSETNSCFEGLSLTDNQLGHGRFSVKIKDADSKFNINLVLVQPDLVKHGLEYVVGVDAAEAPHIVNAIADWIDRDDDPRVGSTDTETGYYMSLNPPYKAKNGPIDDLTELMMIKGITPAMFFGGGGGAPAGGSTARAIPTSNRFNRRNVEEPAYPVGLIDLFTTVSSGYINLNTASAEVLQLIPDMDQQIASEIIQWRNGEDGAVGTEDDRPFKSVGELGNVQALRSLMGGGGAKGGNPAQVLGNYFGVRSTTFEVEVECQIDAVKRTYYALLRRTGQGNQIVTCYMYWR